MLLRRTYSCDKGFMGKDLLNDLGENGQSGRQLLEQNKGKTA